MKRNTILIIGIIFGVIFLFWLYYDTTFNPLLPAPGVIAIGLILGGLVTEND